MVQQMKFVLGKPHVGAESDWYVLINEDSSDLVVELMQGSCKQRTERIAVHDLKSKSPSIRGTSWRVMGAYTKAAVEAPDIISRRFGWYANRNGGMCPDLLEIEQEVDAKKWPVKMTPQELYDTVKISKWFGGKHYYAKLADGREVEWNGLRKWSTVKRAEEATRKFLGLK